MNNEHGKTRAAGARARARSTVPHADGLRRDDGRPLHDDLWRQEMNDAIEQIFQRGLIGSIVFSEHYLPATPGFLVPWGSFPRGAFVLRDDEFSGGTSRFAAVQDEE